MLKIPIPMHPIFFPFVVCVILAGALFAAIKITVISFWSVIPVTYYTLKEIYAPDAE